MPKLVLPRGKPRDPLSIKGAVARCIRILGDERVRQVARKSSQLIRAYSDPDSEREIPAAVALKLDSATREVGHGAPIHEAYTALLTEVVSGRAGGCPLTALVTLTAELGVLAATVNEALADHRIEAHERRSIVLAAYSLIRQGQALIDTVEPRLSLAAD